MGTNKFSYQQSASMRPNDPKNRDPLTLISKWCCWFFSRKSSTTKVSNTDHDIWHINKMTTLTKKVHKIEQGKPKTRYLVKYTHSLEKHRMWTNEWPNKIQHQSTARLKVAFKFWIALNNRPIDYKCSLHQRECATWKTSMLSMKQTCLDLGLLTLARTPVSGNTKMEMNMAIRSNVLYSQEEKYKLRATLRRLFGPLALGILFCSCSSSSLLSWDTIQNYSCNLTEMSSMTWRQQPAIAKYM